MEDMRFCSADAGTAGTKTVNGSPLGSVGLITVFIRGFGSLNRFPELLNQSEFCLLEFLPSSRILQTERVSFNGRTEISLQKNIVC